MKEPPKSKRSKFIDEKRLLTTSSLLILCSWTLFCVVLAVWSIHERKQAITQRAVFHARSSYEKDIIYRRWSAMHGGVYVPVSEKTQPNPYLSHIPERDLVTPSGRQLTLINPAYMTRQVHELGRDHDSVRAHITSLNPIRAENGPDIWEQEMLSQLERDRSQSEAYSVEPMDGISYLRYIKPLITENGCLKCHASGGYKQGDIRGAISVSVPMEPFAKALNKEAAAISLSFLTLWTVGTAIISFGCKRIKRHIRRIRQMQEEIESLAKFPSENPYPVLRLSYAGKLLYANQAAQLMLTEWGHESSKMPAEQKHAFDQAVNTGKTSRATYTTVEGKAFSLAFSPVREAEYLNVYASDVTETVRYQKLIEQACERAEEANRSKSTFLANMSHEIRTPINSILGFGAMLAEENLTEMQRQHVNLIRESGNSLLGIINDILDYSKIEAGKLEVEIVETNLGDVIFTVESIMKPAMAHKKLDFEILQCGQLPKIIKTDPTRLHQCLLNLINNAAKFTNQGHVYVNVSAQKIEDRDFIRYDVEDTGIGIAREKLDKIFESFCQADDSTTRKFGGTGLGLTITKQLAELMGGLLTVVSEVGKGSTFSLLLPAGVDVDSVEKFEKYSHIDVLTSKHVSEDGNLFTGSILVAEDVKANQLLIEVMLKKMGIDTTIVENGKLAIEMAHAQEFDLILMDMMMPVMDGYDAARILKKENYPVPIVALTANAMKGDDKKCYEAGCDEYLTKPVTKRELIRLLSCYLPFQEAQEAVPDTAESEA